LRRDVIAVTVAYGGAGTMSTNGEVEFVEIIGTEYHRAWKSYVTIYKIYVDAYRLCPNTKGDRPY
jgi:hypothetical protein